MRLAEDLARIVQSIAETSPKSHAASPSALPLEGGLDPKAFVFADRLE
jgi:hypothetical protein